MALRIRRRGARVLALLATAALALAPGTDRADPDLRYRDELIAAARAAGVARGEGWLRLGHWRSRLLGGFEGDADGPAFFLAPDGKHDPEAELEATLRGFFEPAFPETSRVSDGAPDSDPEHPLCRFPARLLYLSRALSIDASRLPAQTCARFAAFWRRLSPRSVTFVFSSYYINNPSSAFGHTFLRIGKSDHGFPGDRYDLVDQGVSYAAVEDTKNPFLYFVRGLTGGFRGDFTALPYFYKVREYADFESRDLWEYELELTPAEVALLVSHLWELGHTWFDYYYLTENCAYQVLAALEAAAPRLELLHNVGKVTLPADAVKSLFANPGLVRSVGFRPSARTQFEARAALLSPAGLDDVTALAAGHDPPGFDAEPDQARVQALDAAVDLVDLRYAREIITGDPAADALRQHILELRSAIPISSAPLAIDPPSRGGPERGHGGARLSAGAGYSTLDGPLLSMEGRLALHDLADPPAGFPPQTQIEFLRARVSVLTRDSSFRLDDAAVMEATSINAVDSFERKPSWKFRVGATRVVDAGCAECVAGVLEAGAGPGVMSHDGTFSAMATADVELLGSPHLHGAGGTFLRPGIGPGILARVLAGSRAALLATAGWRWLPAAAPGSTFQVGATGRVHLGRVSLSADWRRTPLANEMLLSAQFFGR